MVGWSGRVVEYLVVCKREGLGFTESWERALIAHPPSGRDLGPRVQQLIPDDEQPPSLVEFLRSACADSWYGRRDVLRHMAYLLEMVDDLEEAAQERRTPGGRHSNDKLVA